MSRASRLERELIAYMDECAHRSPAGSGKEVPAQLEEIRCPWIVLLGVLGFALFMAVALQAQTYTDLHDFDCTVEGCAPSYPELVNSGTTITAPVPVGAKTGKVALKTAGGSASSKATFTVTP